MNKKLMLSAMVAFSLVAIAISSLASDPGVDDGSAVIDLTIAKKYTLTDNYGFVWNISVQPDGFTGVSTINGTVKTKSCGTVPVLGSAASGYYTMYADQKPSATCYEGFEYIGKGKSGYWYNADLAGSGTFKWVTIVDPASQEAPSGPQPGVVSQ